MTRVRPTLDGLDTNRAEVFARRRVLAWRQSCRGPGRAARFSLVRSADVNADDRYAADVAWWSNDAGRGPRHDQGLRIDIALRLVDSQHDAPVVAIWARLGPNELAQSDLGWLAAVRHAAADRGAPAPPLLVITRWGWRCLPAGTSRSWKRLRPGPGEPTG